MKFLFIFFFFSVFLFAEGQGITLTVSDTINPGTAEYIIEGINKAEELKAPFVIIALNTPGGLLHSTRKIVQKFLGTPLPVIVFISPKGAQTGSAGALISFAADVAAMIPGTNTGEAHSLPESKISSDTIAFAESLAKTKRRNSEWAKKSVQGNTTILAEDAEKHGLIDLVANDLEDLYKKLSGFKLRVSKGPVAILPVTSSGATTLLPMSVKQRVLSYFSNPVLSYLLMIAGCLLIWMVLSRVGLFFPGILGGLCILISLIAFQMLPVQYGPLFMILVGMGMILAELFVPAFGFLATTGFLAFISGSFYLIDTPLSEMKIPLSIIFPTAAVVAIVMLALAFLRNSQVHKTI